MHGPAVSDTLGQLWALLGPFVGPEGSCRACTPSPARYGGTAAGWASLLGCKTSPGAKEGSAEQGGMWMGMEGEWEGKGMEWE